MNAEAPGVGEDEAALMRRVAAGDVQALRAVADRYTGMLYSIAWRMLADAVEAEDVVQEAMTKLWVNAAGWTPSGGGLGGWLRRVATNACLDRRRKPLVLGEEAVPDRADESPSAETLIDQDRQARAVAAAMQCLPDRQRAAIVLTYYEGVSNAVAAATLGIGVKALESLLVRARQGLSRSLAGQGLLQEGNAA
ncbi:MAG TPA: sigma-70 family RNA polymerase sigma factor [Sphingomicrobium sp.]|nr:sigma-70 family RNA polymerase sigma factor [Sphingomicrobium sp.]